MSGSISLQYNIAITEESAESLALDESGQVNTELLNEVGTIFVVAVNLWEIMHVRIYFFLGCQRLLPPGQLPPRHQEVDPGRKQVRCCFIEIKYIIWAIIFKQRGKFELLCII